MNILFAVCIAVMSAAPHAGRALAAPPADQLQQLAAPGEIAELLIPLLKHADTDPVTHKKVIQVMPYDGSGEDDNQGWRKIKSNKKQLVEITPLRRKVGNNKHLAYILSSPVDAPASDFEDSTDSDEHDQSGDDKLAPDVTNDTDVDLAAEDDDRDKSDEERNAHSDETNAAITSDVSSSVPRLELKSDRITDGDQDLSGNFNSRDMEFGPGNNILFERGSSESEQDFGKGQRSDETDDGDNIVDNNIIERDLSPDSGCCGKEYEYEVKIEETPEEDDSINTNRAGNDVTVYGNDEVDITTKIDEGADAGKRSKHDCTETERDGKRRNREHKSYSLSFLFNK